MCVDVRLAVNKYEVSRLLCCDVLDCGCDGGAAWRRDETSDGDVRRQVGIDVARADMRDVYA
jgi:hypothetical protein